MKCKSLVQCLIGSTILTGCFSLPKADMDDAQRNSNDRMKELRKSELQPESDGLRFVKSAYLGSREVTDTDRKAWLVSKRITFTPSKRDAPSAKTLALMLREEFGLNIASSLPLDGFTYTGLGVRDVDGETALRLLFGPMGLDYEINNENKYITIVPIRARTWTLSIGNRNTTYSSGSSQSGSPGTQGSSDGAYSGGSNTNSSNTANTSNSAGNSSANTDGNKKSTSTGSDQNDNGGNTITSKDSLWTSLSTELSARLTVMIPNASPATTLMPEPLNMPQGALNAPLPSAMPSRAAKQGVSDTNTLYRSVTVGTFALNPETGAVTVQAPSWILDGIGKYLDDVEATYNTKLTFEGQLLLLTASKNRSEGLDIQAFIKWAGGRYGAVLTNNVLNGGVQVSFPNGSLIPSTSISTTTIAPTNLGIISPLDGLQIFNGYLESIGDVRTLQKPTVSTTHGVPVEFEKYTGETYSIPDQNVAAGGTGSASVGTKNIMIKEQLGTLMRVNPRYDAKTGLVRAQVYFNYNVKVGTDQVTTYVSGANGTTTQSITPIPKTSRTKQSGEILARDGDLVVLSGTVEDSDSITNGGIAGLSASPFFGKRGRDATQVTYYFALRVKVDRKGLN